MLKLNKIMATTGAAFTMGLITTTSAHASDNRSFNAVANNIVEGISGLPGLLTALSYMMGLIFSVLGVLKIKDHVENPSQAQLSHGAIRLAVGGALFMIPVVTTAMQDLIGDSNETVKPGTLNRIKFETQG